MFTYSLKQQLGRGLKSDSAPLKPSGGKELGGRGLRGLNWNGLMIHAPDMMNVSAGMALKSEGLFIAIRKVRGITCMCLSTYDCAYVSMCLCTYSAMCLFVTMSGKLSVCVCVRSREEVVVQRMPA